MPAPDVRAPRGAYALLFGAAFLLRALVALEGDQGLLLSVPVGDEQVFHDWGARVARGEVAGEGVLWQAPGAAWLLGAWYALVGPGLLGGRLLQAILGAGTAVLLADLGRRLVDRRAGLAAGWLWALYAPAVFFGVRLGKPAAATFFFTAALQLVLVRRPWTALLAGAAVGAAALTRESLVLVIPLVLFALGRARGRGALGLGLLGVGLAGAPLVVRNVVAGAPALSYTANFGPNLWIGNHAGADGLYQAMRPGRGSPGFERRDARLLAERAAGGETLDDGQVSAYWRRAATSWAAAEPLTALTLTGKKAWLLAHDTEWMDSVAYGAVRTENPWLGALGVPLRFGVLLPLALLGALYAGRSRRYLVLPVVLLLAAHLPFFVFGRFRAPVLPLMALLAVLGVRGLWVRRDWRAGLAALAALLVAVAAFLPAPASAKSPIATSFNNVGVALLERGRLEDARAAFERAVAADPQHANANFHLGEALAELGDLDAAEPFLVAAVRAAPHYDRDARLVVVRALLGLGRPDVARRELEAAARLPEVDAEALHRTGLLFRELGDGPRAREAYLRALELDPHLAVAANDLGYLRLTHGELRPAAEMFERALAAEPALRPALVNLSSLLASAPDEGLRDGSRALDLALRAGRAGAATEVALDLEAMALAELGRFGEAAQVAGRAIERARAAGKGDYASQLEHRRALYLASRPFRSG